MLASTSETMITPAARKIARLRAGKGVPSDSANGRVSTPARVMAPRTPATEVAAISRQLTGGAGWPRRMARAMFHFSENHAHTKRRTARAAVIAST